MPNNGKTAPYIGAALETDADDEDSASGEDNGEFLGETIIVNRNSVQETNVFENTNLGEICHYFGRKCLQTPGANRCIVCIEKHRRCHFDRSQYRSPCQRKDRGKAGAKTFTLPKPLSMVDVIHEILSSSDQNDAKSDSEYEAQEPEQQSMPTPCRRCYYDGRKCRRSQGEHGPCDKRIQVGQKCNPDLTGIQTWRTKSASSRQMRIPKAQQKASMQVEDRDTMVEISSTFKMPAQVLKENSFADPLVVYAPWLPKIPTKPNPEARPCRRCFNEGHFCYRSQGPGNPCETCSQDRTGIVPHPYRKHERKQEAGGGLGGANKDVELSRATFVPPPSTIEAEDTRVSAVAAHVTDPLIKYKEWLPNA